jgi:Mg2+ and Co2+ transporter CorA
MMNNNYNDVATMFDDMDAMMVELPVLREGNMKLNEAMGPSNPAITKIYKAKQELGSAWAILGKQAKKEKDNFLKMQVDNFGKILDKLGDVYDDIQDHVDANLTKKKPTSRFK